VGNLPKKTNTDTVFQDTINKTPRQNLHYMTKTSLNMVSKTKEH